jgi:hypothetical protein
MELTSVPQIRALKKCAAALLVLLQGTSLLVTPSTELTFVGFLHWKESTGGHSVILRGYRGSLQMMYWNSLKTVH